MTAKTWRELREAVVLAEAVFHAAGSALREATLNERRVESEALHARLARGVRSKLGAPTQLVRSLVSLRYVDPTPDGHAGDPVTVARHVNERTDLVSADKARQADDDQPVTVWHAPPPVQGPTIPRPPAPAPIQTNPSNPPSSFSLDHGVIESTLRSTSLVSELLRDIFTDDVELDPAEVPRDSSAPVYAGLDAAHSRLLTWLAAHPQLPRIDFDATARTFDVLPGGAIDTLNEAALDTADEPLIEGDDTLVVSLDVLQEMMK